MLSQLAEILSVVQPVVYATKKFLVLSAIFTQTLSDPIAKTYTTHSECSIEFEVDGPYKVT